MLRGTQGMLQECPRGCPGGCGASSSPTPSLGAKGSPGLGEPLAATGPQALASAPRRGWGGKEGPLLPSRRTQGREWGSVLQCSSPSPAVSRGGGTGDATFTLPPWQRPLRLLQTRLRTGRAAGSSNSRSSPAGDGAPGPGTPRSSGQWGGHGGILDPCKAREAPAPPRVMSQAEIPVSGWGGNPWEDRQAGEASAPAGVKPQAGCPMS